MYGLSIASVLAVLMVLSASLTVLPALLSRWGERLAAPEPQGPPPRAERRGRRASRAGGAGAVDGPGASVAAGGRLAGGDADLFLVPVLSLRLDSSDAGNDPSNTSTYQAFNLLVRRASGRASTGRC